MSAVLIGPLLDLGGKLIERLFPDPQKQSEARLELFKLQQGGHLKELDADMQIALAQSVVNAEDAKSPSLFKSGWRPASGWICVVGMGYSFILQPFITWLCANLGLHAPPILDSGSLMAMLSGLLGLGGMRSFEKAQRVAAK